MMVQKFMIPLLPNCWQRRNKLHFFLSYESQILINKRSTDVKRRYNNTDKRHSPNCNKKWENTQTHTNPILSPFVFMETLETQIPSYHFSYSWKLSSNPQQETNSLKNKERKRREETKCIWQHLLLHSYTDAFWSYVLQSSTTQPAHNGC